MCKTNGADSSDNVHGYMACNTEKTGNFGFLFFYFSLLPSFLTWLQLVEYVSNFIC